MMHYMGHTIPLWFGDKDHRISPRTCLPKKLNGHPIIVPSLSSTRPILCRPWNLELGSMISIVISLQATCRYAWKSWNGSENVDRNFPASRNGTGLGNDGMRIGYIRKSGGQQQSHWSLRHKCYFPSRIYCRDSYCLLYPAYRLGLRWLSWSFYLW